MTHSSTKERPPVVAIMGHIDHGKSTLLAAIRKSAAPSEAGGITQHISAYEVEHHGKPITFLDTPGHAAFEGHRHRGASAADIAVLVVAADDGVKPQTLEAIEAIKNSETPFIVAFTKIDKNEANLDRAKTTLAEAGIYVEGFGGTVSWTGVSGTTGAGIDELLDLILLTAELEHLQGDAGKAGEGLIIESTLDNKKGVSAVCIIKDGSIHLREFIGSSNAWAPVRAIADWTGTSIQTASFSSPVTITGWNQLPIVGSTFKIFKTRDEAEQFSEKKNSGVETELVDPTATLFPLVIKADVGGSLEALRHEINNVAKKSAEHHIIPHIIAEGVGAVSENDVRSALGTAKATVIGFHVKVDGQAKTLSERDGIEIKTFDVIYKFSEWLAEALFEARPRSLVETMTGRAKVLKTFSKTKDKQILGARCEEGVIKSNEEVRIIRRGNTIGEGRVRELQLQKSRVGEVEAVAEFGTMIECKLEIMPGDMVEAVAMMEK